MQLCSPAKSMREKAVKEGELLKAKGFNVYETQGYTWYQWAELNGKHEELVEQFVQNKAKYCMNLVKISQDSYQGLEVVLDEILELMKIAQPHFLYLRYVFNFKLTVKNKLTCQNSFKYGFCNKIISER